MAKYRLSASGVIRDMTAEEIAAMQEAQLAMEHSSQWSTTLSR